MQKTNAMRLLETAKIPFTVHEYPVDENDLSGVHVASVLQVPAEQIFKTLVLRGERIGYFVCCIPADAELDLKKAAAAAGDKRAELLPLRELLAVTGYVRGGCSPIGMKKPFPTLLDETCILFDQIYVSSGARGAMLLLSPETLTGYIGAKQVDLMLSPAH